MKTFLTFQLQGVVEEIQVAEKIDEVAQMIGVTEGVTEGTMVGEVGPKIRTQAEAVEEAVAEAVAEDVVEIAMVKQEAVMVDVADQKVVVMVAEEDQAAEENLVSIEIIAHQKGQVAVEDVAEITRENLGILTIETELLG